MLKKTNIFLVFNIAVFLAVLALIGYGAALSLSIVVGVFILFYNRPTIGIWDSMALVITYMMIFDNDFFSFTSLNLRVWYILLIPLLFKTLWTRVNLRKLPQNANTIILFLFAALCLFWFVLDPIDGKLSLIKYLLFSIGTLFALKESFVSIARKVGLEPLIDFCVSIASFVAIWGVMQFSFNLLGVGEKFQFDFYNIRPAAFFSETTWYAEYCVIGMILCYYRYKQTSRSWFLILLLVMFLGVMLSVTRNAYLALVVWMLVSIGLGVLKGRINLLNPWIVLLGLGSVIFTLAYFDFWIYFERILDKFFEGDASSQGRMDSFDVSLDRIAESPIIGHGFSFNLQTDVIGISGTSVGAKNANLILMLLHIFGGVGLVTFLFLMGNYTARQVTRFLHGIPQSRYSIIILVVFTSMSLFAPLHQFPFGMYVIALSVLFGSDLTLFKQRTL